MTGGVLAALTVLSISAHPALPGTLPEGDSGIAAGYPGDVDIADHADVVFVEDFEESSIANMKARWEDTREDGSMTFSGDVPSESSGSQSLLAQLTGPSQTADHLYRRVLPGYDELYVRYYVKFDPDSYRIHHFTWMGGHNPSTSWPWPRAGERPDGDERFSSGVETMGNAWRWDFYTYWMNMRGNPGGPEYWGNDFINDSNLSVAKSQWVCVEHMMKMNSPTSSYNGEQAVWIDGQLWRKDGQVVSHLGEGFPKGSWTWDSWHPDPGGTPFEGYRWRTTTNLKINYVWIELYITSAPSGKVSKVWFDDFVVAKSYIGPISTGGANHAPVLSSVGDRDVDEGEELVIDLDATDEDTGDTLTFSASGRPSASTFGTSTGVFTWTPGWDEGGDTHEVTFGVSDGHGGTDSETITITVNEVDDDTDGDGDPDATDPDDDGDGLDDSDELAGVEPWASTDPLDPDSDDDGWSDGDEVAAGTDPNDGADRPSGGGGGGGGCSARRPAPSAPLWMLPVAGLFGALVLLGRRQQRPRQS